MTFRRSSALVLTACLLAILRPGSRASSHMLHWPRPELAPLVREVGASRPVEARLTGGFAYGPWNRDVVPADAVHRRVLAAAFSLFPAATGMAEPPVQAALGSAFLLAGRTADAVTLLQRAIAHPSVQPAWFSDLAAAYLTRGDREGRFADYVAALAMAERAISHVPGMPEPYFNRALALERMALPQAAEAWGDYLIQESHSGFAAEALARRNKILRSSDPRRGIEFNAGNLDAPEFAPYFEWGDAAAEGDRRGMSAALQRASVAARTDADSTDRLHARTVEDLQLAAGDPHAVRALCAGLRALRDGYAAAARDSMSEASAHFAAAVHALDRYSRALSSVAAFRLAVGEYYASRHQEAVRRLTVVERTSRKEGFAVLRARALRVLGLIHATAGRFDAALTLYQEALESAEQAGARTQVVALHNLIAEVLNYLGRTSEGWDSRGRALVALRDVQDAGQRKAILTSAALAALDDGYPESAAALHGAVEGAAQQSGSLVDLAEAGILRARVEHALGNPARSEAAARTALEIATQIQDLGMRARVEAELALVTNEARTGEGQVDAALAYFSSIDALSRLTEVYLVRAAALGRRHDPEGQRRELNHALQIFDRRAAALSGEERRLTHDQTGRPLYEALIDMAVRRGAAADGLAVLARYHTRLDTGTPNVNPDRPLDAEDLTAPGTALLAYATLRDRLVIWVAAPGEPLRMFEQPVGRERLSALVDSFVDFVASNDRTAAMDLGETLFRMLLGPASTLSADRLWILPDGPLHRLPFGALPESRAGRFAVERWTLAVRTSLSRYQHRPLGSPLPSGGLVVGNPTVPGAAPLEHAEREAQEIARQYPGAVLLTGRAATARGVAESLRSAPVFHFGGHAVVNRARPLLSRLLLASAEDGNSEDLFVYDLQEMELKHVQLAVLAACRAADARSGAGDGVVSLARTLLVRGVGAVVAGLFDLADRPAKDLFVRFHEEYRRTADAAGSLRVAQLEQVKRGQAVPMRDWAAVIAVQR